MGDPSRRSPRIQLQLGLGSFIIDEVDDFGTEISLSELDEFPNTSLVPVEPSSQVLVRSSSTTSNGALVNNSPYMENPVSHQMGYHGIDLPNIITSSFDESQYLQHQPLRNQGFEYQPAMEVFITIHINGVEGEVPSGPTNLREMLGEDVSLVFEASGINLVVVDQFGFLIYTLELVIITYWKRKTPLMTRMSSILVLKSTPSCDADLNSLTPSIGN